MENAGSYSTLEGGREIDEGDFVCSRKITQSVNRHRPRAAPTPLLFDYWAGKQRFWRARRLAHHHLGNPHLQITMGRHFFNRRAVTCAIHPYRTMTTGHVLVSPDLNIRVALGLHPIPLLTPLSLPRIGAYRNHNCHRKPIPYRSVPVEVWGGGDSTQHQQQQQRKQQQRWSMMIEMLPTASATMTRPASLPPPPPF